MFRLFGRLTAFTLIFALAGGYLAECQGWLSTPEERMACCADEQECPLHKAAHHVLGSNERVSQSDADRCCATSERGESMPASVKSAAVDGAALIPVNPSGVLASPTTWFSHPLERLSGALTNRPRHVLLSVFLI